MVFYLCDNKSMKQKNSCNSWGNTVAIANVTYPVSNHTTHFLAYKYKCRSWAICTTVFTTYWQDNSLVIATACLFLWLKPCYFHALATVQIKCHSLLWLMVDIRRWIARSSCSTILSSATFPGAPSYSGVRTWVEDSQTRRGPCVGWSLQLLGWPVLLNDRPLKIEKYGPTIDLFY